MNTLLPLWAASAALSAGLFLLAALTCDGRIILSKWIRLWLAAMALLGPLGTLLTVLFLTGVLREVRAVKRGEGEILRGSGSCS